MERLVAITRQIKHFSAGGRITLLVFALTVALLGMTTVSHGAPSVSASLDTGSFAVDQSAALTITIHDGGESGTIAELPPVQGLVFERRGQSSQYQIVNGSLSSSVSTIFQIQAARPGTYTLPPISITVDGQQLQTSAITFEVVSAGNSSRSQQQEGEDSSSSLDGGDMEPLFFLRVSPVKEESYAGEILPVEIKVYFRRGLRARINSRPTVKSDSFLLSLPNQEPLQTEEMVNNLPYAVLTWSGVMSGIKDGEHSVSVAIEATALFPENNRRKGSVGGDPFVGNDPLTDFFNQRQVQEKKIQIVSKAVNLKTLALPAEGRPADFSGAIGRFELQVKAQPTDVEPGDPITLTMTVQGTGNFDRVEAPMLTEAEGWKAYSPGGKLTPGTQLGQGSKVFEQAIIGKGADKGVVPPVSFSFFDPEARSYQTLRSEPIPLHVKRSENAEKSEQLSATSDGQGRPNSAGAMDGGSGDGQGQPDAAEQGRPDTGAITLAPLRLQLGSLQQEVIPLVCRSGFQLVILCLFLFLVAIIWVKIRAKRVANNPVLRRQREMGRLLDLRLREIKEIQEQGNSRDFLAHCRLAIQEQLGLIWQTGPSSITLADLRQRLAADSGLIPLFATAESGIYVGNDHLLSSPEMTEYVKKLEQELRRLQ